MISAKKSKWFESVFALYNRNLISRRFECLRVAGLNYLLSRKKDAPLVLYVNHSSWWDPLMIFQINRHCRLDGYAMMEEKQLRVYKFFRRLGAFGVVRENPREALRSVDYISNLLRETDKAVWLFPQGITAPNDIRPLKFYNGAARIIEKLGKAYAAPVAIRYEFLEDYKPEIFARIGAAERFENVERRDVKNVTSHLAEKLTRTLDKVKADILNSSFEDYEVLTGKRK